VFLYYLNYSILSLVNETGLVDDDDDDDDDDSRIVSLKTHPISHPVFVAASYHSAMRVRDGASERFLRCLLVIVSLAKVDSASQNKNEKCVPKPKDPQVLIVA
jgi:hypothetical protein